MFKNVKFWPPYIVGQGGQCEFYVSLRWEGGRECTREWGFNWAFRDAMRDSVLDCDVKAMCEGI